MVRNGKTGRFLPQSFEEKYPTGRKVCSGRCGRWRHVSEFPVKKWDKDREKPLTLISYCKRCEAARQRENNGYKPRNWYNCGNPGTERYKKLKTQRKRERYHVLKNDPEWIKNRREYYRFYNNAKGRKTRANPNFDLGPNPRILNSLLVAKYFDRFMTVIPTIDTRGEALAMNGVRMDESDQRKLSRWRQSDFMLTESQVDKLAVKYDLPTWEAIEAGKITA